MLINHVSVGVTNLDKSAVFYDAVMGSLEVKRAFVMQNVTIAYGENFEFWIGLPNDESKPASAGNGTHIAFNAKDKQAVEAFYQTALANGGTCGGKPGLRPEYSENYYAAFVFDPDGNKLEAYTAVS